MTEFFKRTVTLGLIVNCFAGNAQSVNQLSDAPDSSATHNIINQYADYETALHQWKGVKDVNTWIKNHFRYDMQRAKQLANNSITREQIQIYAPAEFYQQQSGTCIDLSRFTVETLRTIDTSLHARYLLIEFEPLTIDGKILKNHWLTIYQVHGEYYFMADSKWSGQIKGPYKQPEDFIHEYEMNRQRKITGWKILSEYQRKRKTTKAAVMGQQS